MIRHPEKLPIGKTPIHVLHKKVTRPTYFQRLKRIIGKRRISKIQTRWFR